MIRSLKVSNYKGIDSLEMPNVPRISLIGGKNNAGKSSLLEAVFLSLDKNNPEIYARHFGFRGLNQLPMNPDFLWRPIFFDQDLSKRIEVETQDDNKKKSKFTIEHIDHYLSSGVIALHQSNIFNANPMPGSASPARALKILASYQGKTTHESYAILQPPNPPSFEVKQSNGHSCSATYISSTMRGNPQEDAQRFGKLDMENKTSKLLEMIQLIEPKVENLSVVDSGAGTIIYAEVKGYARKIPIPLMGDGVSRALTISLAILTNEKGIVLIDEIENGFHYSVHQKIWGAIKEASELSNCQILATTHSYECLTAAAEAFDNSEDDVFSYFRLSQPKEGHGKRVTQYSADEIRFATEDRFEVR